MKENSKKILKLLAPFGVLLAGFLLCRFGFFDLGAAEPIICGRYGPWCL